MYTHPGGKLLFMGNEFGQTREWDYKSELDWHLLQFDPHKKLQHCVAELNLLLRSEKAMFENQFKADGFEWIDLNHRDECVMVYRRKGKNKSDDLLIILNMLPEVRYDWEIYVYGKTFTKEIFNSDMSKYWGTGHVYNPEIRGECIDTDQELYKIKVNLPPLAGIILK